MRTSRIIELSVGLCESGFWVNRPTHTCRETEKCYIRLPNPYGHTDKRFRKSDLLKPRMLKYRVGVDDLICTVPCLAEDEARAIEVAKEAIAKELEKLTHWLHCLNVGFGDY
jgi:hypothetical protein